MGFVLGVDTGGTYTDAVIINDKNKKVEAKSKAFTRHENLSEGIDECMNNMPYGLLESIQEVHLSTTIAMNSILENRFDNVGLLLIGRDDAVEYPANYIMTMEAPAKNRYGHFLSLKAAEMKKIRKMFSENVDYVVVASDETKDIHGIEHRIADIVREEANVGTFCVSDYCDKENHSERIVSAMLTIYLKPVVDNLVKSVKKIMKNHGIQAELMMVNAMGEIIACDEAQNKPLSTMFSGLATSVTGGLSLFKERDFLMVDMGGTSTDITRIINGKFREVRSSSKIGKYTVKEKAIDVQTFGIGGDSHIRINLRGEIIIEPRKVIPICFMSDRYPYLVEELKTCKKPENYDMLTVQEVDCFIGVKDNIVGLTSDEREIVKYLKDNPHNVFVIAEKFRRDPDALHLDKLVKTGAVRLISVTPTDVLHSEGIYTVWNVNGADVAIKHMAKQLGMTKDACITKMRSAVTEKLIKACMQGIANFEKQCFDFDESQGATFMLERFYGKKKSILETKFEINKPILALGAPTAEWMKDVAFELNAKMVVPEHGEVANAFGAAIAHKKKG